MTEQEYRASLKRHHICRNCKQTDAYTLAGRTYCAECAEKDAEKKRKLRANEEYRQKAIQRTREWRNRNVAENRCARCGKHLPTGWKNKCCCECLTYSRKKAKERRQKAGALTWDMRRCDGICFICGEPTIGTRKMCEECYQKRIDGMIQNLEKAHEKQEIKKQVSYEKRMKYVSNT